ncbi:hypothetical protein C8R43DRAFT_1015677 [Mycena crocata]|nr:hypothetical protein C8R43DRAFT_1015677 [Mycena crocata]
MILSWLPLLFGGSTLISPGAVLHVPSTIMHSNLRRLPAERVRHRKRLPFQGWPDAAPLAARQFTLTGPITFTQVTVLDPDATTSTPISPPVDTPTPPVDTPVPPVGTPVPPTDSITTPLPSDTTSLPVTNASLPPVVSASQGTAPLPIASAINPGPSNSAEGANTPKSVVGASKNTGLPTGAIVGITIACVMLILGVLIFFLRQRSIRNRKLRRQTAPWMGANGSFETREVAPFPPSAAPGNMGETSPGVSFARAQAQALAARAPVPNMPQPMPSSYNNPVPAVVPAGAAASATVRYEFIPTLPDELSITTGEVVRMLSEYDDGWALCANGRGDQGMVPLECLDQGSAPKQQLQVTDPQDYRNSRRTSSLGVRY